MAVTTNQVVKRQGRDGKRVSIGVAAAKTIYAGTLVYLDAGGDATDVIVDANTVFAGVAVEEADNSSGADGDITVEVYTDGDFEWTIGGTLADSDIGTAIYGTDNFACNQTSTGQPALGKLVDVISETVGIFRAKGLGET